MRLTGDRLTIHGVEEHIADCVIQIMHKVGEQIDDGVASVFLAFYGNHHNRLFILVSPLISLSLCEALSWLVPKPYICSRKEMLG